MLRSMWFLLLLGFTGCNAEGSPVGQVKQPILGGTASTSVDDAVVLVARADHTNRARLLDVLQAVPKRKLIGLVMNCVPN